MNWERSHQKLEAWKMAMSLVRVIYQVTKEFPADERYGLSMQLRRASVSIPSNIAEGAARGSQKELTQFLVISRGSLSEVETQLLIAVDLGYLSKTHEVFPLLDQTSRLISGLRRYVSNRHEK